VFGTLGVGWVMVWCPRQYDDLMRSAGGVWEPGARQWLVERRRIGPVIRELERTVNPLLRQAGILRFHCTGCGSSQHTDSVVMARDAAPGRRLASRTCEAHYPH
jgi:hypothetical protein